MFTAPIKKRAPLKQLRMAAQDAFRMLRGKKIAAEENILERMAKDASAPILPGIPSYLPHRWTIRAAQQSMLSLLKEWVKKTNNDLKRQENASEFFRFVVGRMQDQERKFKKEVKETGKMVESMKEAPLLSDIFSPLRKSQTTRSMHKFFIDSFAISVIVHMNGSTGDYADWFLNEWTPSLYNVWSSKKDEGNK